MARDATGTREKLIRAAEQLFAARGVNGAQTREIVRAAGQANDSAVHYHFGSRQGLLAAISDKHVARMEPQRRAALHHLDSADLVAVIHAIVEPTAAELESADGRDFLRIIAQIAGHAGIRTGTVPSLLRGTALLRQLELLRARCLEWLPEPVARERIAIVIGMLTAALAERARQLDDAAHLLLAHAAFVENLVAMIVAALGAPAPSSNPADRSALPVTRSAQSIDHSS